MFNNAYVQGVNQRTLDLFRVSPDVCCDGDYSYEKGHVVHEAGCHGSVLANEEAKK